MKQLLAALLSTLVVDAAQGAEKDPKSPELMNYGFCLLAKAHSLDDHVSDAATIAKAMKDDCLDEQRVAEAYLDVGAPPSTKAANHKRLEDERLYVVLLERRTNSN